MFASIESALEVLKAGKMIILVDDESRENEGDLAMLAEAVTPEAVNFMAKFGRGLICLSLAPEICDALRLAPMVADNRAKFGTAFTVSVEAACGVTTGISAADRAHTIRTAVRPGAGPGDLVSPGHVFPLRASPGGVLMRAGQTEGIVDLARIAGTRPAGVICEVMKDDGTMARLGDLAVFARSHGIPIVTIAELIRYRLGTEKLIRRNLSVPLKTHFGDFDLHLFSSPFEATQHLALTKGDAGTRVIEEPVLVRMHSECLTGDVFGSALCDCGQQLWLALEMIEKEGRGAVLYLRQEGRGIGLENKLKAYLLQQEKGLDTVQANEELGFPADKRDYGLGAQMLLELGIRKLRLLTNNPRKMVALEGYGLSIVERVPLVIEPTEWNRRYLETKRAKLGHYL
ncbi:MAG: GTP cyclohydrolase II [Planctomycetota bacterium]